MVLSRSIAENLAYQAKTKQATTRLWTRLGHVNTPRVSTQRDRSRLGGVKRRGRSLHRTQRAQGFGNALSPSVTIHTERNSAVNRVMCDTPWEPSLNLRVVLRHLQFDA